MDGTTNFKITEKGSESSYINTLVVNETSSQILIPGGNAFLSAEFIREGYDLTLKTPDGQIVSIPDYFMTDTPPDLLLGDGSVITADLATKLAGPMAPGQYAQLQTDPQGDAQATLGSAIGSVSELQGSVMATRADGTQVTLSAGDPIYQGDVLETSEDGTLGVIFADDTTFSLDSGGRMVIDEMVYDPDAQSGVFETTVVKGVFSFVSGQVAKTDGDAMVINTPKTTIGIRGSTGLIKSGAEDGQDQITLVPDIDGNLGELIVSNQAGSQVLNQPNASTTVFSAILPPAPVVFMSAQQIQQSFGNALTVLVRTEAKKAVAKVEHAARQAQDAAEKATQQQGEAAKAKEEAAQAEDEASAAQADAEAARAEAEAAKAAAEAITDVDAKAEAEAKAAEAEAKALEAQAKAEADTEAAAIKVAEAAAQAEQAVQAEQQAATAAAAQQAAQQFSQMAGSAAEIQQQVFTQFLQTGVVDPNYTPGAPLPGGPQGGANGPGLGGAQGMIYISPTGEAFTVSANGEVIVVSQDGSASTTNVVANLVDAAAVFDETFTEIYNASIGSTASTVTTESGTETNVITDDDYTNTDFQQTITAVNGGGSLAGGSASTNFYFPWATLKGGVGGTYTVTDSGTDPAAINQISFDGMDNLVFKVIASSSTSGTVTLYNSFAATIGTDTPYATISYSNIPQFLLADVTVSSFATNNFTTTASGDVLKLSGLEADQTAYVLAGTSGGETIAVNFAGNAIVFGKGGVDTFTITATAHSRILGGEGDDIYNVNVWGGLKSENGFFELSGGAGADHYDYSGLAAQPSLYVNITSATTTVWDASTYNAASYVHNLEFTSSDTFTGTSAMDYFYVTGGSVGTINGGGGDDTFTVSSGASVASVLGGAGNNTLTVYKGGSVGGYTGGTGDDSVIIDSALLANAITIDGGTHATTDNLTIKAYSGGTIDMTSIGATLLGFEKTTVTGVESTAAVTLTGKDYAITLDGSAFNDTLNGSSVVDTLQGQDGNDTLFGKGGGDSMAGGTGADIFKYTATTEGGDSISDFVSGTDKFNFQSSAFNGVNASGTLDSTNFISGVSAVAGDANDYFVYNSTTQTLYYDVDGNGGTAQVAIASFATDVGLQSTDIVMI